MAEAYPADRQILRAKLCVPRARPDAVTRTRLRERLDEGARGELTVISAPAGFGKTSLLAGWVRGGELPVAWISLDERDDDPARFLSYLIAAVGTIYQGFGATARAFLDSRRSGEGLEPALTALSNEIVGLPGDFVLVLDDYHAITARPVHDALAFLLDHSPPPMRLVIAGRAAPPLPLARLRGRGRLTELGVRDLRFTPAEAGDFLQRTMGLNLDGEGVAALEGATEGWIAGLQLAAHALKGREDEFSPAEAFAGGSRHVFDYLADEVLSCQPEDVRVFLLKTSVVETLSGSLCEALTDQPDGRGMLERLERANLFLVPLDGERCYYRYHHLFAAFLRERLRRAHPEDLPDLHRRAALWYEDDGCQASAVEHALAAEDFDRAADLIERESGARRGYADAYPPPRWLGALPDELVRRRPRLCLLHAWVLVHAGEPEEAERRLGDAEEALKFDDGGGAMDPTAGGRATRGEICAVRARVAAIRDDAALTTELANRALDLLPEGESRLRGEVALDLALAHGSFGDLTASGEALDTATASARSADDLRTALYATRFRATLGIARGRLREAEGLLSEGQRLAEGLAEEVPSITGLTLTATGELLYERGDLDGAQRLLEEGIPHDGRAGDPKALAYGHVNLARVLMARGDAEGAHSLIRKAGRLAPGYPLVGAWRARFHLMQGDVASAARWAGEYGATADYASFPRHVERITIARVLLAEGRTDEALASLNRLLEDARSEGRTAHEIEILALLALVSGRRGARGEALAHLGRALSLAEPEGSVRVFVDEGPPMAALLASLIREPEYEGPYAAPNGYAGTLLQRFVAQTHLRDPSDGDSRRGPGRGPGRGSGAGLEPLTGRETEVLELVAAGGSNAEIAAELYLSVGTVKAHLHHIFGKLLVRSRSQAVARARELRLLDRTSRL